MFTKCSFDEKENKLDYCRREDSFEKLCKKLKRRTMEIINYEKKEMVPLTYEENKSYEETCHICEEKFCMDKGDKPMKIKESLKITAITQESLEELLIVNAA